MQISDLSTYNYFKNEDNKVLQNLQNTTIELSTGYKILDMSQNPGATQNIIDLKNEIATISTFSQNAFSSSQVLTLGSSDLGNISDYLQSVNTLALQGANFTYNSSQLVSMGNEMESYLNLMLSKANDKFGPNYIFGGSSLSIMPFDQNYNYLASSSDFLMGISSSEKVPTYLAGNKVFGLNIQNTSNSFNSYTQSFSNPGTLIIHDGAQIYQINYNIASYDWEYNPSANSTTQALGVSGTLVLSSPSNTYTISYSAGDSISSLISKVQTIAGSSFSAFAAQNADGTYAIAITPLNSSGSYHITDSSSLFNVQKTPSNLLELSNYINSYLGSNLSSFIFQNPNKTFSLEIAGNDITKPLIVQDLNKGISSSFVQQNIFNVVSRASQKLQSGSYLVEQALGANSVVSSNSFTSLTSPIGNNGILEIYLQNGTKIPITYSSSMNLLDVINLINQSSQGAIYATSRLNQNGTYSLEIDSVASSSSITANDSAGGGFYQFNSFSMYNEPDIFNIQQAITKISYENAKVGTYLQILQGQNSTYVNQTNTVKTELASIQDASIPDAITDYSQYQLAYESIIAMFSNQKKLTILNYV